MGAVEQKEDPLSQLGLPPGFRFHPTDQELMVQYLCRKVAGQNFPIKLIGDVDLYKYDPWTLPSKAMFGEKEWYFFSPRDRKYPNGTRPNRVAGSGYWKATGTDKVIKTSEGKKVGIKKALVFYVGKAPSGSKTNWIMHEYRLNEPQRRAGSSKLDEWVLCRIYKKSWSADRAAECSHGSSSSSSAQSVMNNNNININNNTDNVNYEYLTAMGGLNTTPPPPPPPPPPQQFVPEQQIVMPKQSDGVANSDNYKESDQMLNNMLNNNQEAHTAGTLFYPYGGYINPAAVPYALPPYINLPGFTN